MYKDEGGSTVVMDAEEAATILLAAAVVKGHDPTTIVIENGGKRLAAFNFHMRTATFVGVSTAQHTYWKQRNSK